MAESCQCLITVTPDKRPKDYYRLPRANEARDLGLTIHQQLSAFFAATPRAQSMIGLNHQLTGSYCTESRGPHTEGTRSAYWRTSCQTYPAYITPRGLASFLTYLLSRGVSNGRRIIEQPLVFNITTTIIASATWVDTRPRHTDWSNHSCPHGHPIGTHQSSCRPKKR